MAGVIPAEMLAIQLVAAVHRDRLIPRALIDGVERVLAPGRHAVCRDRARIEKRDDPAVAAALRLRELEQAERPVHVDLMGRDRRELAARREQRGKVIDAVDLELGQNAVEKVPVVDRT